MVKYGLGHRLVRSELCFSCSRNKAFINESTYKKKKKKDFHVLRQKRCRSAFLQLFIHLQCTEECQGKEYDKNYKDSDPVKKLKPREGIHFLAKVRKKLFKKVFESMAGGQSYE